MVIKNKELNDETITCLNELLDKDISPKVAFDLLKISAVLESLINNKNKIQQKILEKYAQKSEEDPNKMYVKQEFAQQFQSDMNELMEMTHDISMDKIKISDLKLQDNIKTRTLGVLRFMFEIDLPEVTTQGGESFKDSDLKIDDVNPQT